MRILTASIYFVIAIIICASVGVSIPYVFEILQKVTHNKESLNQNLVTYYIAIFTSSSLDLILKYIDKDVSYKKPVLLIVSLINMIVVFLTGVILYYNSSSQEDLKPFIIIGIIFSWIMWWFAHYKDESFNASSSLGGSTDKKLKNG